MNTTNNFTGNPYIFGVPIRNKDQLYGRKKIIEKIENNFRNNQKITLLHVQRRIGKTSLIDCLPQLITEDQGFKFVDFSLQGYEYKPIDKILNDLADRIAEVIGILPNEVRELVNHSETFFIEEFLPKIINKYLPGKKLVLLLDEFDILGKDEKMPAGKNLFNTLEKAVEQEENLFAILVFGRPVKDMTYLKEFLKKQTPIEVGLLNRKDTEQLIVQQAQGILKYELGAIEAIWQLSAGHPSLTQLLCRNIFAYYRTQPTKQVVSRHIELILEQTMQEGIYVFEGFLQPLNKPEKLFFRAVAEIQERDIDPLKIIKQTREITTPVLRHAGERLVEYGFLEKLEKQGTSYKIKVELVRRWLLKNYPLSDEERLPIQEIYQANQNITETNNNGGMPTQNGNNNSQGPNQIYKFFSLLLVPVIFITLIVIFIMRATEPPPICNDLPKEIDSKIGSGTSEKLLETLNKFRQEKSLIQQCPNFNEIEGKFYELLHKYGEEEVNNKKIDTGIKTLCSIPDKYAKKTQIKQYINKLIAANSSLSIEEKRNFINEIFKQNEGGNKCPAYSLEDETNKKNLIQQLKPIDKFYDEEAKKQIRNNNYQETVELYCEISEHYLQLPQIKQQLENWSKDKFEVLILRQDREKIISTLGKIGKDNCPAYPDI
ncbi:hypothetical protein ACP6PL_20675 [Dapis sp. BLCC M126]|uniref:hypothetical protein n=1 Tax=Dapis sp. BLCC M126 TaxID=3400189 RepID=UPI003CF26C61